jgi:hypothetical protein
MDARSNARAAKETTSYAEAIWKAAISFGLVVVPVNLCSEQALLQRGRVEVPWSEVEKGYEYAKGQYVVVADQDFEKTRALATHTFAGHTCRPPIPREPTPQRSTPAESVACSRRERRSPRAVAAVSLPR